MTINNNKEFKTEDVKLIQERTNNLFQVIDMIKEDGSKSEEEVKREIQICRNEIIELNIRLVTAVLKKYKPFTDDQFQTGCVGLILATNSYDMKRGVPFSSFAWFCIERELHKVYQKEQTSFEFQYGSDLVSIDQMLGFSNGDETSKHDMIADLRSEEEFMSLLDDFQLAHIFTEVIYPAIEEIGAPVKGPKMSIDPELWKRMELNYILEMSEVDSQKARMTFSQMSKELGLSVQNIRMKHQRVISLVREKCEAMGLLKRD